MDPDQAFFLIADPDSGSGFRIRIPDPDPGFDDLNLKKITAEKKDAQATGEAFSPQKRTSSTSKHENSVIFSIFVGHFLNFFPSWIQQLKLMRIRI
jgi:hypothetical protein